MGVYTKFKILATLRKDLPVDIQELFICLVYGNTGMHRKISHRDRELFMNVLTKNKGVIDLPDHPFFKMDRFPSIFSKFPWPVPEPGFSFYLERKSNEYVTGYPYIHIQGEINYGIEVIETFVDWLTPYVAGHSPKKHIGYWRQEGSSNQIQLYADTSKNPHGLNFTGAKISVVQYNLEGGKNLILSANDRLKIGNLRAICKLYGFKIKDVEGIEHSMMSDYDYYNLTRLRD